MSKPPAKPRTTIDPNEVVVFGGPSYMRHSEDGPQEVFDHLIGVTINGVEYVHHKAFKWNSEAEDFADKIRKHGSVNLEEYWVKQEPRPSLEEMFDMYAEREQAVRMGLIREHEMYDGLP